MKMTIVIVMCMNDEMTIMCENNNSINNSINNNGQ